MAHPAAALCQHGCYILSKQSAAAWTADKVSLLKGPDVDECAGRICTVDSGFITAAPLAKLGCQPSSAHFFGKKHTQLDNTNLTLLRPLQGKLKRALFYGGCATRTEVAFSLVAAWPASPPFPSVQLNGAVFLVTYPNTVLTSMTNQQAGHVLHGVPQSWAEGQCLLLSH